MEDVLGTDMEKGRLVRSLAVSYPQETTPGRTKKLIVNGEETRATEDTKEMESLVRLKNADGKLSVKFGVLFQDDKCANLFEALVGTLKAAKRRKVVTYPGELLLQGVHDDVDIVLLQD
uniref:Costars family protein ABRACL n=1 Tax=Felis catus TaxID=9685 RepID=A0ABI7X2E2_FELCA